MRQRNYQNKGAGVAIRDDGVLVPSTKRILAQSNIRPYTGDVNASLEERLAYLQGLGTGGRRTILGLESEVFDIRTANKDELLELAETDYGVTLDPNGDVETVRAQVKKIVSDQKAAEKQADAKRNALAQERADAAKRAQDAMVAGATADAPNKKSASGIAA